MKMLGEACDPEVSQKLADAMARFEEDNLPQILPTWKRLIMEWAEIPKQLKRRRSLRDRKATREALSVRN